MKTLSTRFARFSLLLLAGVMLYSFSPRAEHPVAQKKILVFSKTAKFRHGNGIAAGIKVITQLGKDNDFAVEASEDAVLFTAANLKQYAAVVFLSTTGDILDEAQQNAFQQYIRGGGGFMGIHASADTEYDWPWYGELNGAYFGSHPAQQEAVFTIVDSDNPATKHLPKSWKRFDELYNFKWLSNDLKVIMTIDENSYNGGKNGEYHPMAWYHAFDGGRAFYTALGHDEKSFNDPMYVQHLLGGIRYAAGIKTK